MQDKFSNISSESSNLNYSSISGSNQSDQFPIEKKSVVENRQDKFNFKSKSSGENHFKYSNELLDTTNSLNITEISMNIDYIEELQIFEYINTYLPSKDIYVDNTSYQKMQKKIIDQEIKIRQLTNKIDFQESKEDNLQSVSNELRIQKNNLNQQYTKSSVKGQKILNQMQNNHKFVLNNFDYISEFKYYEKSILSLDENINTKIIKNLEHQCKFQSKQNDKLNSTVKNLLYEISLNSNKQENLFNKKLNKLNIINEEFHFKDEIMNNQYEIICNDLEIVKNDQINLKKLLNEKEKNKLKLINELNSRRKLIDKFVIENEDLKSEIFELKSVNCSLRDIKSVNVSINSELSLDKPLISHNNKKPAFSIETIFSFF